MVENSGVEKFGFNFGVEMSCNPSFVSLPAEEVTIYPNIRPEHPKILGIPIPGFKVGSNPPAITGSPIPLIN